MRSAAATERCVKRRRQSSIVALSLAICWTVASQLRKPAASLAFIIRPSACSIVALSLPICWTVASQLRKPAASFAFIIRPSACLTLCRSDLAWPSHARHAASRWRSRVSRTVSMTARRRWTAVAVCARHATNMTWRTTPLWLEASIKALRRYSAPCAFLPRQTRQASFSAIDRWCTEPLLKSKRADLSMR